MSDLISRQAAIEHLKKRLYETALNNVTEHPYYEEMADNRVSVWLKEVPSAQPEQRWIPCSERLPEESGRYLVTNTQWGAYHVDWNIYYVNVEGYCDGWLWKKGCIAWMPLPEPWKGEER